MLRKVGNSGICCVLWPIKSAACDLLQRLCAVAKKSASRDLRRYNGKVPFELIVCHRRMYYTQFYSDFMNDKNCNMIFITKWNFSVSKMEKRMFGFKYNVLIDYYGFYPIIYFILPNIIFAFVFISKVNIGNLAA